MTWPALPARVRNADDRDRARPQELATACGAARVLRSAHAASLSGCHISRCVPSSSGCQYGFTFMPTFSSSAAAVDDVGDEVDADVERDARDRIGLGAAERRRAAMGDGVGEHRALARHLAPFDVAPPAGEDAHRPREVLILLGRLAVLDDELLLPRRLPERHGEVEVLDVALDAERVVQCDGHGVLASLYSGTSARAALEPQLRP